LAVPQEMERLLASPITNPRFPVRMEDRLGRSWVMLLFRIHEGLRCEPCARAIHLKASLAEPPPVRKPCNCESPHLYGPMCEVLGFRHFVHQRGYPTSSGSAVTWFIVSWARFIIVIVKAAAKCQTGAR
jgi:hypothetical protein